jgi:hypothetical protein
MLRCVLLIVIALWMLAALIAPFGVMSLHAPRPASNPASQAAICGGVPAPC